MTPVVERLPSVLAEFHLWPVVDGPYWLPLGPATTSDEVGTLLCTVLNSSLGDVRPESVAHAVQLLLDLEPMNALGGLLLRAPETTVVPGCCFELREWRDWTDVLAGTNVYLGHDPAPWVEFRGDELRMWADGGLFPGNRREGVPYVDVDRAALSGLLLAAQRDLIGFLGQLRVWAGRHAPDRADELVSTVDERLGISAPLR